MAVLLDWLSKPFFKAEYYETQKYGPASSSGEWQAREDFEECAAAYERVVHLRELLTQDLGALSLKHFLASGAEAVALQQEVDQCWATIEEINHHGAAILFAYEAGRDFIDLDSKFWREHKELFRRLPESLQPASFAAAPTVPKESSPVSKDTSGIRRREHQRH